MEPNANGGSIPKSESLVFDLDSDITYKAVVTVNKMFQSTNHMSMKTPISLLQEICMSIKMAPPIYEEQTKEGQIHDPVFIFKASILGISAYAKATSKKKAKQAAALALLMKMEEKTQNAKLKEIITELIENIRKAEAESGVSESVPSTLQDSTKENGPVIPDDPDPTSNPIGEIIEITQKNSLRPPEFDFGEEEGPPHNRQFSCNVKLGDITEIGYGRSKKLAKRQVALKLLARLKTHNFSNSNSKTGESDTNGVLFTTSSKDKSKKNSFNNFKNSTKSKMMRLLNTDFDELVRNNELNKEFLERMSVEEGFEYNFFQFPPNPNRNTGLIRMFLQVKINPPFCFYGQGLTLDEATNDCVYNWCCFVRYNISR